MLLADRQIAYISFLYKVWYYVRQELKLSDKQQDKRTCVHMKDSISTFIFLRFLSR